MKKVWKYIIITLLSILGLACVGVLYLFFVPGSSLFNITYIYKSYTHNSQSYKADNITTLAVNSRAYEVNILESENDEFSLKVYANSFGFVLNKNKDVQISSTLNNNVLTFNISEPYGFAIKNDSYINVYIPKSTNVNLSLNNQKAKTNFDAPNLNINQLSYSTQKGNFNFKNGSISNMLKLTLNKSTFQISENVKTNNNNVELNLSSGKFISSSAALGDISVVKNTRGIITIKACNILKEQIASSGGQINVEKLSRAEISTSDSIITLGEVANGVTIDLNASGSISVASLSGNSSIVTNSGNVNIGTAFSPLLISSISGNIKVSAAMKNVSIVNSYGESEIHFAEEAENYTSQNKCRSLTANIKNGKLIATGVQHIGTPVENEGINISGNGRIYLYMNDVLGENYLDSVDGNIFVSVNKDSKYLLTTSSEYGNVRVNLTQTSEYNGYTTKTSRTTKVNCSTSANKLTVSTSHGNLTILDTNFS